MPSSAPWCGYRRLSEDRDGNKIGVKIQTEVAEAWAARNGIVIGHWFEDLNLTAADEDVWRDDYEQMLADVQAGVYAGIIVYRCDRLSRLSGQFDRCLKVVRAGEIVSADENLRSSRGDDVTMMKLKVLLGEAEIRGMKVRIKANKTKRSHLGNYSGGGRRPYGFAAPEFGEDGKTLTNSGKIGVEHVAAEVANLQWAAERITKDKWTYSEVISAWHSRTPPIFGVTGAPWSVKTLQTVLRSPRMVGKQAASLVDPENGEVVEHVVDASWLPVLDQDTWEGLVKMAKFETHRDHNLKYLLTGLLLCGTCQQSLSGASRKYAKAGVMQSTATYRCRSGTADKARGSCGKLSVLAEPVEMLILGRIFHRLAKTSGFGNAVADEADLHAQLDAAGAEAEDCEAELIELAAMKNDPATRMSISEWKAHRTPLVERRDAAKGLARSLAARMAVPTPTRQELANLPGWFEKLSFRQKRKLLDAHIRSATILAPGRSGRYFDPGRVQVTLADAK